MVNVGHTKPVLPVSASCEGAYVCQRNSFYCSLIGKKLSSSTSETIASCRLFKSCPSIKTSVTFALKVSKGLSSLTVFFNSTEILSGPIFSHSPIFSLKAFSTCGLLLGSNSCGSSFTTGYVIFSTVTIPPPHGMSLPAPGKLAPISPFVGPEGVEPPQP